MTDLSQDQLSSLQQDILEVVHCYPSQFSRSGLAKILVGAKSWQNVDFPEYGRFSSYRRKDILYQIDILLQQHYLRLDAHNRLAPAASAEG